MNPWRRWFSRNRWERETSEEMRFHIERQTLANLAAGMSPEEARRRARAQFGATEGVLESCREQQRGFWLETLWADVRYGFRMLRRSPGFTAVAILTLALGIGANTAIFSIINGLLLQPLPFQQPDRLVNLSETEVSPGAFPLTGADYLDWQEQNRTLDAVTLYDTGANLNASGAGEAEPALGTNTQAIFFSVLGVPPLIGRTFDAGSDAAGKNHVVVLSYGFWKRQFAGARDAIGKSLELNNQSFTVIGVMPPRFNFPAGTDLWAPLDMAPKSLSPRGTHQYLAVARMKAGVTPRQAQADLAGVAARLEEQYPNTNHKVSAVVTPLKEQLVGQSRQSLWILLGAVGLVLLVACANVANLLLARSTARSREIAVRAALGAGRRRIVQQLLTESVLLAIAGAIVGCMGAGWFVEFARVQLAARLPQASAIRLDGTVLLFTVVVSVLVGVLFGLAPALHAAQLDLNEELRTSAAVVNATSGKRGLRDALIVGEIAVSLALLLGAGLLLRSFAKLRSSEMGFDPSNVLTARISLPQTAYPDLAARRQFFDQLLDRIQRLPGVETASISNVIPLRGGNNGTIEIAGDMNPEMSAQLVEFNKITPDFFTAYRIPLLEGRNFTPDDANHTAEENLRANALTPEQAQNPPADLTFIAIINRKMAREFWPKQDPVGKVFKFAGFPISVIGVVGDAKESSDLRRGPSPAMYLPLTIALDTAGSNYLTVKTKISPAVMIGPIREEIRRLDSRLALFNVRTMDEVIAESMQDTTLQTLLLGSFAALALLLPAIGIYGVMAYTVSQRRHEFGVRMALGAQPGSVSRLVLWRGIRLAFAGVAIGLLAALALARLMSDLVFGVSVWDPVAFAGAALLLVSVALAACYIPARRATRVDPMVALRYE
ncbi:MAG: ABC transporter permease [Candidatus Acidiferrales bacterium]